ncbi:hypothetical protein EBU95_21620, partial [bacterium]|nr:hypothetical protein [bacterium]
KAMDAWNKKPESGYSSAPRKTIRQFAGAMDADRRLRGQGITKGKEGQAQRQIDYAKKMRGEEVESLDELNKTHSDRDVKMAIGIINDKRYKGGNLTGALKAIDKMKPGLSDHPAVIRAMRTANEEYELNEKNESHTHAAHYENDKGEWTGMNLLVAKSDDDAIKQAHEKCKEGCRLSRVERHIPVKEEVESLDELSPATHQAYRKAAGTQASALDKQAAKHYASGNVKAGKELTQKANKRFSGIVKSTVKESKRPEDDTVPFVTNENKPLSRAKEMARKSMERIKNEMMGKTGTSE